MAATLKHDSAGFLVGELIDVKHDLLEAQDAGMIVWRGIHSDVKAIARALRVQVRGGRGRQAGSTSQAGPARDSQGRYARRVVDAPAGRTTTSGGRGPQRTGSTSTSTTTTTTISTDSSARPTATTGARRGASERAPAAGPGNERREVLTPAGRNARGRFIGAGTAGAGEVPDSVGVRDALGRFTGGAGGTSDKGGDADGTGRLTSAIEKLGLSLDGADQLDPAITAMKEVQEVLTPVGRGFGLMFGRNAERNAERKKVVWYKRLIKAITGKSGESGGSMGGRDAVQSGSFMGTLTGELLPKVMAFLAPILLAVGGVILGGLSLLGGLKLGELIYKWLSDSGVMARIFDAIDGMKQAFSDAGGWIKAKYEGAKDAIAKTYEGAKAAVVATVSDFDKGMKEQTDPVRMAPPVLDASGRNANDPRRLDRDTAVNSDGRMMNDPRRLDAQAPELAPATSMAQRAGRMVGNFKNAVGVVNDALRPGSKSVGEHKAVLISQLDTAGITDPTERAAFMAQADHESGGFKYMQELGGSSYFKKYDGRKDLGNSQPGDGERFKGRGFFQLTGRANYRDMGKKLGLDLENNPELAAQPDNAAKISTQFWQDRSRARKFGGGKISALAKAGNIDGVTQGINGGMNGAQERRDLYATYLQQQSGGATLAAGTARIPTVSIPSSVPERIAPAPESSIPTQLNTAKQAPVNVSMREPIGQNVGDRSIAHVVGGGLGMMS